MTPIQAKMTTVTEPTTPDVQTGWLKTRPMTNGMLASPRTAAISPSPIMPKSRNSQLNGTPILMQIGGITQAGQPDPSGKASLGQNNFDVAFENMQKSSSEQVVAPSRFPTAIDADAAVSPSLTSTPGSRFLLPAVSLNETWEKLTAETPTDSDVNKTSEDDSTKLPDTATQLTNQTQTNISNGDHGILDSLSTMPAFRNVMLPDTKPDRPLTVGTEVHLVDDSKSDPTGQITYKIMSIDSEGLCNIAPVPTTLMCPPSHLVRAPLFTEAIVSIIQPQEHLVDGKQEIKMEQVDWGSVVKRSVVNGERMYDVASWDEQHFGKLWVGLKDENLGQLQSAEEAFRAGSNVE